MKTILYKNQVDQESGFTLVEVLASLVILTIFSLALYYLFIFSLRNVVSDSKTIQIFSLEKQISSFIQNGDISWVNGKWNYLGIASFASDFSKIDPRTDLMFYATNNNRNSFMIIVSNITPLPSWDLTGIPVYTIQASLTSPSSQSLITLPTLKVYGAITQFN